jgi:hypothetical protein
VTVWTAQFASLVGGYLLFCRPTSTAWRHVGNAIYRRVFTADRWHPLPDRLAMPKLAGHLAVRVSVAIIRGQAKRERNNASRYECDNGFSRHGVALVISAEF